MSEETNKIIVNYRQGCCGEFILSLLQALNGDANLSIEEAGSCHNNRKWEKNQTKDFEIFNENLKDIDLNNTSLRFIKAHCSKDYLLLKKVGNHTIIKIVHDNEEWGRMRQARNIVFKVFIGEWDRYGQSDYNFVKPYLTRYGFSSEKIPKEMDEEELHSLIVALSKEVKAPYHERKYDAIKYLSLQDIYQNKEKVLNMLETLSGLKRNKYALDFYDEYLRLQP